MHNSFLIFDFGANEEAAQQARHKLEGWRQAFRLDKKLQFKFDRGESGADGEGVRTDNPQSKDKDKTKAAETQEESGKVKLLVRLYFSGHEKLSHQRWIDRIPSEEPFKGASSMLLGPDQPGFDSIEEKFQNLE